MKQNTTAGQDEPMSQLGVSRDNTLFTGVVDDCRRSFLKRNALAFALASSASMLVGKSAWAGRTARRASDDNPPLLDPKDPQAAALNYTSASHKTNQQCSNCQLYTGTDGEEFGPCAIFSYRVAPSGKQLLVEAGGWCRAWGCDASDGIGLFPVWL